MTRRLRLLALVVLLQATCNTDLTRPIDCLERFAGICTDWVELS